MIQGYYIYVSGEELYAEEFRERYLVPLCGSRKSYRILQAIIDTVVACSQSELARERLEYVDERGLKYINYSGFGVHLLLRCNYCDDICDIIVVECERKSPDPP